MKTLVGKICIVTGATRGIGKGIALQLGEAGATVYITGRTLNPPDDQVGGSLRETAKEVENRGGKCIPVQCDHSKDDDVVKLFDKVKTEQDGRLDILVNNAYSAVNAIMDNLGQRFWENEPNMWDDVNNVGLRNHYICSVYAARMMVERQSGLIVNISSVGGLIYFFNVAYGVGKAACDRMAVDCGSELKKHNVTFVSLWPGPVNTETISKHIDNPELRKFKKDIENGETVEYAGKCIVHLANDPNIIKKTARILLTAELGDEYGFDDVNGRHLQSFRQVKYLLQQGGAGWIAPFIPGFIKIPYWMLTLASSKF
ncbi:dehydrogenase/reductase SDR family member 1 isoform X1 [Patella vulgata]|uniref:dehydrogenase/reductase SDR family member 1 isoform X1 n=1 Tax=Patella vulgata TaxID=6465 RepID=UPI00217F3F90|nr:dehydrogenase/reductase SDR family member 1 isoform X1 [Patella vulgata]XP_050398072.1 dehydrogenase/reductase SDR family member 1 isoform X1 [Patella vulgata]